MSKRLSDMDFERAVRRADENAPMELAREAQRARDAEARLEQLVKKLNAIIAALQDDLNKAH